MAAGWSTGATASAWILGPKVDGGRCAPKMKMSVKPHDEPSLP